MRGPPATADIYVMSAEGGKPRAHDGAFPRRNTELAARWTLDLLRLQPQRRPPDLENAGRRRAAVQVTQQGGFEAFESPDGKLLLLRRPRPGGIWQVSVRGREERQVPELLSAGLWRYWGVLDDGIYFVAPVASARPALKFFSFATRRVTQLGVLERDPLQGPPG